jgi:hypothetical protein
MKAKNLIDNGETAAVIFTDGRNFRLNDDGTGYSGNWRVRKDVRVDKVVVYVRKQFTNDVYVGDFVQLVASTEDHLPDRRAFKFVGMKYAGSTRKNWNEFTDAKHGAVSPVRYIS